MYHGMKGPENSFQIYRAINDSFHRGRGEEESFGEHLFSKHFEGGLGTV